MRKDKQSTIEAQMVKSCESVWESCLNIIKDNVSGQSFKTWFQPINPVALDEVNKVLTIQVPSQFFYEWLEEHYVMLLRKSLQRELGESARLEYQIVVDSSGTNNTPLTVNYPDSSRPSNRKSSDGIRVEAGTTIKNPFIIAGLGKITVDPQLLPRHQFDCFIEGDCNRLARSAGYAVAEKPGGTAFNPLIIHGGVGLGKTHLAQAIGNKIRQDMPSKVVLYVNMDRFISQYLEAVRNNSINDFVHFYQQIDVLIVDDIQFLAGKEKTQNVFFYIFNHLHQQNKQLVFTSDRAPNDIEGMEERLLSRFKWGLTADLQPPDFDTRIEILNKKMYADGIELPKNVVEFVAYNIDGCVRDLEGALVALIAHASLNKMEIDLELAKKIIRTFVKNASREISVELIQKIVCEHYDLPVERLREKTRKRQIVMARQLAMFLAKKMTKQSLKLIGKSFGGRDHSTVIHSCQMVRNQMDIDPEFHKVVRELEKKVQLSVT